jgi:hypothetical protein
MTDPDNIANRQTGRCSIRTNLRGQRETLGDPHRICRGRTHCRAASINHRDDQRSEPPAAATATAPAPPAPTPCCRRGAPRRRRAGSLSRVIPGRRLAPCRNP